jgi:hypothetical protein
MTTVAEREIIIELARSVANIGEAVKVIGASMPQQETREEVDKLCDESIDSLKTILKLIDQEWLKDG